MIYLASPYSHPSPTMRESRYLEARFAAGRLLKDKMPVFSPIVYGHHVALEEGLGFTAEDWKEFNGQMLARADRMIVLCLPGWRQSEGVQEEIRFAKQLGKLIDYMTLNSRGYELLNNVP